MSRSRNIVQIVEEIYGKLAVVYHRTNDKVARSFSSGNRFYAGFGDMYGRGVYGTYDLSSQFNRRMEHYGDYLVKAKVNLNGFLIFDADIAKQVYPNHFTLNDQLKYVLKTSYRMEDFTSIPQNVIDRAFYKTDNSIKSSSIAMSFHSNNRGWLEKYTRGIIFTGDTDGRVVVAYDPKSFMPMSIAYAPVRDGMRNIKFVPVEEFNKSLLNRSVDLSGRYNRDEYSTRESLEGFAMYVHNSGIPLVKGRNTASFDGRNLIVKLQYTDPSSYLDESKIQKSFHMSFDDHKWRLGFIKVGKPIILVSIGALRNLDINRMRGFRHVF